MSRFQFRRSIAVGLAVVLLAAMLPGAALAADDPNHAVLSAQGGVTAQANVAKDTYEPDDWPAQAKPMPAASYHTWHPLVDGANDADWMYFTVDTTGTPVLLETWTPATPNNFTDPMIKVYDADGSLEATTDIWADDGQLVSNDDHLNGSLDAGLVFIAPHPGKYFVRVQSDDIGSGQWGEYWLFGYKGIGRRIAGADRYDTTVNVSKLLWGATSNLEAGWRRNAYNGIVIANGKAPADALAAGILAAMTGSPLLLTSGKASMTAATKAEFDRLALTGYYSAGMSKSSIGPGGGVPFGKTPIYAIGGSGSMGDAFVRSLGANQYIGDVKRITGADRYALVANVMQTIMDIHATLRVKQVAAAEAVDRTAVIVNGAVPSDMAAAAPVASSLCASYLLTKQNGVPKATLDYIAKSGITRIVVVGGTGSISAAVYARLRGLVASDAHIVRVAGPDRYTTNIELVRYMIDNADSVNTDRMIVISGTSAGDAFAAVPLSAQMGYAPVLFTPTRGLSYGVKWYIDKYKPLTAVSYMIGGEGSINRATYNAWNSYGKPFPTIPYTFPEPN